MIINLAGDISTVLIGQTTTEGKMTKFTDGHEFKPGFAICPVEDGNFITGDNPSMENCPGCHKNLTNVPRVKEVKVKGTGQCLSPHLHRLFQKQ